jgi:hypothetical protein
MKTYQVSITIDVWDEAVLGEAALARYLEENRHRPRARVTKEWEELGSAADPVAAALLRTAA